MLKRIVASLGVLGLLATTLSTTAAAFPPEMARSEERALMDLPTNGMFMVSGTSTDPDAYQGPYAVSLPPGKNYSDIVDMAIAKSNDHVYVWYDDYTVSQGTSWDFDYYSGASLPSYDVASGRDSGDIVGIGISSSDRVFTWYNNGTVSQGRSQDLGYHVDSYSFDTPNFLLPDEILGMGIAGSNDRTYAWFSPEDVSNGTSWDVSSNVTDYGYPALPDGICSYILAKAIAGNDHVYTLYRHFECADVP